MENEKPEDFEALLRKFLSGQPLDPEELSRAAGLPIDPAALQELLAKLTAAIAPGANQEGINWEMVETQAKQIAGQGSKQVLDSVGKEIKSASDTGALWLDEVTDLAGLTLEPKLLSRQLWVADSIGLFRDLATPVANRMSDALTENFKENLPEEFSGFMAQASGIMKSAGSVMFAIQLGQALGKLSEEVLSGGDIGLPIFKDARPAFVAQNLAEFIDQQEEAKDQLYFYLVIREHAHARLFKNSKWLRDYVVNLITSYAREITIDNSKIIALSEDFDPADFSSMKAALESGALIAPRTAEQTKALERIETVLALIEGWVDCVTNRATGRLPRSGAIAELVRRKRASGGPAEKTFLTLIGLELRPRQLRESSMMWNRLTDELGIARRDAIWSHPDLLPTASDIQDPTGLIASILSKGNDDEMDQALRDLLS